MSFPALRLSCSFYVSFFFSSRRRHTRSPRDWSSDVCSSDLHLHAVITLPTDDSDYSLRWRLIKTVFSRNLPQGEQISTSRASKNERGIWQRRYWEHRIRSEERRVGKECEWQLLA